jgi:hypothetical protein
MSTVSCTGILAVIAEITAVVVRPRISPRPVQKLRSDDF